MSQWVSGTCLAVQLLRPSAVCKKFVQLCFACRCKADSAIMLQEGFSDVPLLAKIICAVITCASHPLVVVVVNCFVGHHKSDGTRQPTGL